MTQGERAEQLVEARLRAAIDPAWRLYPNVPGPEVFPAREEVGRHRIHVAEPGPATLERVRLELHRLERDAGVAPWRTPC